MPRLKITSFQNSNLKEVQLLREAKARKVTGLTIVEGLREMSLAWRAKVEFQKIFVSPESIAKNSTSAILLQEIDSSGIQILEVSKDMFAKISYGERMDGLLAVCRPLELKVEDIALESKKSTRETEVSLWVVVEAVEKPGNLGAILRTCDAAGVDGLFVCGQGTDLYNPNVIRASLGAIFTARVVVDTNDNVLEFLKEHKIQILATTPGAQKFYTQADFRVSSALVLGSEDSGLGEFWLKNSALKIKVPMLGQMDSLNVSTATAVVLYEALRQRNNFDRVLGDRG